MSVIENICVSVKLKNNPLIKNIKNYRVHYEEIESDIVISESTCLVYLSLRYHNLNPNYIYERLNGINQKHRCQILLALIDISDPHSSLKELTKVCILAEWTLMCCWSLEEGAGIIQLYKSMEKRNPSIIMEKSLANSNGTERKEKCIVEALTKIKCLNKTDSLSLIHNFESIENIVNASSDQLTLCPGLGPNKAQRLYEFLNRPFFRD